MNDWVLFVLIALPLVGGVGLMFLPGQRHRLIRGCAIGVAALSCLLAVYTFLSYDHRAGGFQFTQQFEWLPVLGLSLIHI